MSFKTIVIALGFLASGQSTHAFGQAAWGYLELLHSASSTSAGDRWGDDDGVFTDSCPNVQGEDCVAFVVPKELVAGHDLSIVLSGPAPVAGSSAFWHLTGPYGEAVCVSAATSSSCLIQLKDLGVSADESAQYLTQQIPDPFKRQTATVRAQEFLNKPILRYWHGIQ